MSPIEAEELVKFGTRHYDAGPHANDLHGEAALSGLAHTGAVTGSEAKARLLQGVGLPIGVIERSW